MRRGAPVPTAPVLMILVILPKPPLTDGSASERTDTTGWSAVNRVVEQVVFSSPDIEPQALGNLESLLKRAVDFEHSWSVGNIAPEVPHVPFAGAANAAGLNQLPML